MTPTSQQIDAIKELINIGVGRGASVLNSMLSSHILLQVPFIKLVSLNDLKKEMKSLGGDQLATVGLKFQGIFSGTAELIFPAESASKLVTVLTGENTEPSDLDSVRAGTLCEVGNIVLNGVMGSISNILKLQLSYTIPSYSEKNIGNLSSQGNTENDRAILLARTRFTARKFEIQGDIVLLFEVGSFSALLDAVDTFVTSSNNDPSEP